MTQEEKDRLLHLALQEIDGTLNCEGAYFGLHGEDRYEFYTLVRKYLTPMIAEEPIKSDYWQDLWEQYIKQ